MPTRRVVALIAAALVAVMAAGCTAGPAPVATPAPRVPIPPASGVQILLPEPTGPFATGTTSTVLRDPARRDDGVPGVREVVTQFWYPTTAADGPVAPYAPPAEARAIAAFYPVPAGALEPASTHSRLDAPAAPGSRPVVLLTHGLCGSRTDLTAVAEQLASEGFVAAATANTGESLGVAFPDGRFVGPDLRDCRESADSASPTGIAVVERLQRTRVADQRLVLDTLARRADLPAGLGAAVDPSRAVGVGHSAGGSTMIQLAADDPRVLGAVDLDGFVLGPVSRTGTAKPVLVLGSGHHSPAGDPSWARAFPLLPALRRLRVPRAGHYAFFDLGAAADRWGLRAQMDPATWATIFGDAGTERVQQLTVRATAAFVRRTLTGGAEPLLDGPSPGLPGVEFREGVLSAWSGRGRPARRRRRGGRPGCGSRSRASASPRRRSP